MRASLVLALALGCGSSSHSTPATTTSEPTSSQPTAAASSAGSTVVTTTTTSSTAKPASTPASSGKYSCFSYVQNGSQLTRHACMRTAECGPYLEQAKSVGGIRETSGCANVASVYCFHQVATKDEPDGLDVCQPSLDECKTARADVVRAKMSVDSDCGQR